MNYIHTIYTARVSSQWIWTAATAAAVVVVEKNHKKYCVWCIFGTIWIFVIIFFREKEFSVWNTKKICTRNRTKENWKRKIKQEKTSNRKWQRATHSEKITEKESEKQKGKQSKYNHYFYLCISFSIIKSLSLFVRVLVVVFCCWSLSLYLFIFLLCSLNIDLLVRFSKPIFTYEVCVSSVHYKFCLFISSLFWWIVFNSY